jgi:hypothetical protein
VNRARLDGREGGGEVGRLRTRCVATELAAGYPREVLGLARRRRRCRPIHESR